MGGGVGTGCLLTGEQLDPNHEGCFLIMLFTFLYEIKGTTWNKSNLCVFTVSFRPIHELAAVKWPTQDIKY